MSKYSRQHYKDVGKLLGRAKASKKEVNSWSNKFKKDNPRFKPKMFKSYVESHRPKRRK